MTRLSWHPSPLRLYGKPSFMLGQLGPQSLQVVVVDANGKPISDANVQVGRFGGAPNDIVTVKTDSAGLASFPGVSGPTEVRAAYENLSVSRKLTAEDVSSGTTQFLQFQICVADPVLRPIDFVIVGSAAALICAGSYFKLKPLETVGEVAIGAAIFGFIYRLRCL